MTKTQGWILILVVALSGGWWIAKDVASWPTSAERALENHRQLMERLQ